MKIASYWSNNEHEVDFVSENTGMQVCYSNEIPEREYKSLIAFKRIFGLKGILIAISTTDKTISAEEFMSNPKVYLK